MQQIYLVGQVVLALVLGAALGWQRGHSGKWAGLRTYALVTAGSALFTILSVNSFGADIARVAAQIVTGIGFLGAGTILHKETRVEGLTTAAGLWMTAAIGMAVGVGFYILSIASSVLIFLVLMFDDRRIVKETETN
ncbi:MgtC/SapB family protein [Patescibacteria group bacterium]|nr:MAG: MgtC/SapB family protein [Patescibacteria group bacterium]